MKKRMLKITALYMAAVMAVSGGIAASAGSIQVVQAAEMENPDVAPLEVTTGAILSANEENPQKGADSEAETQWHDAQAAADGIDALEPEEGTEPVETENGVNALAEGETADTSWYESQISANAYTIGTPEELMGLAALVNDTEAPVNFENKTVSLNGNIDLSGVEWKEIGPGGSNRFRGTFDGNGYTVQLPDKASAGLFGKLLRAAVQNVTVKGNISAGDGEADIGGIAREANLSAITQVSYEGALEGSTNRSYSTGGIAGYAFRSRIENCTVAAGEAGIAGEGNVGGIAGSLAGNQTEGQNGVISRCTFHGGVTGAVYVGGIVGKTGNETSGLYVFLTGCEVLAGSTVESFGDGKVGGIVGYNVGTIENCVNHADVTANGDISTAVAGGIAGMAQMDQLKGGIKNCRNTGKITSVWNASGIANTNPNITISNCCNNGQVEITKPEAGGSACGLVRNTNTSNTVTLNKCFNTGRITAANSHAYQVAASAEGMECTAVYYDSSNEVPASLDELPGAEAMPAAAFADRTVTDRLNQAEESPIWYQGREYPCIVTESTKFVEGIAVDSPVQIGVGETVSLNASASPEDADNTNLSYKPENEASAEVLEISPDGQVKGKKKGTGSVTVTALDQGVVTNKIEVKVVQKAETITLGETEKEIEKGQTYQISANVQPEDADDKTLAYTSDKPEVAEVTQEGLVTGKSAGTAVVSVKSGAVEASVTITVTDLELKETKAEISVNGTYAISANVIPESAAEKTLTYNSSDTAVATVDSKGVVTGKSAGTAVITVSSGTLKKEVEITVKDIRLAETKAEISVNGTYAISANVIPESASDRTLTYTSSDTTVAAVDNKGVVTGKSAGTAVISVKSGVAEAKVTITVTDLEIKETKAEISVNGTYAISANVIPESAAEKTLSYNSSDTAVAAVDNKGVVTGKSAGTAVITVSSGTLKKEVAITVKDIQLAAAEVKISVDETYAISANVIPESASERTLTYRSSDEAVATVDDKGVVTGKSAGTAEISVKCGSLEKKVTVTVTEKEAPPAPKEVSTLTISPIRPQTHTGKAITPRVTVKDGSQTLQEGKDYTVSYADNKNIGTARITITGKGDYTGKKEIKFQIIAAKGKTYTKGKVSYEITNASSAKGTVVYKGTKDTKATKITIPDKVKIGSVTYKVTSVDSKTLKNNKKVKTVVIGANVVTIGDSAFSGCKALTSVTIGKNVKVIGKKAFYNCRRLKKVTIKSKKLAKVGSKAFQGIHKKAVVRVPAKKLKAYRKLFGNRKKMLRK